MQLLRALEWAFGAFLVVFLVWQVIIPLLCDRKPFAQCRTNDRAKRKKENTHV